MKMSERLKSQSEEYEPYKESTDVQYVKRARVPKIVQELQKYDRMEGEK